MVIRNPPTVMPWSQVSKHSEWVRPAIQWHSMISTTNSSRVVPMNNIQDAIYIGSFQYTGEQVNRLFNAHQSDRCFDLHRVHSSPLIRGPGTCIGALFIDQTINRATADVETWLNIWDVASNVNGVCVQSLGFGGKETGSIGNTAPCIASKCKSRTIVWGLMVFPQVQKGRAWYSGFTRPAPRPMATSA